MNQPSDDDELRAFVNSTKPTSASSEELAKLDEHIAEKPGNRPMDAYTKGAIGMVVFFAIIAYLLKWFAT